MNSVALLIIGNEIITGKVRDENGYHAALHLRRAGVQLCEIRAIADAADAIVRSLTELLSLYPWVITSGGLGPTHDDITIPAIARALGEQIMLNQEMITYLKKGYGEKYNESVEKMAWLPEKAGLIRSPGGEWPLIRCDRVFLLPGVPILFRKKIMKVCEILAGTPVFLRELLLKLDESEIAAELTAVNDKYADVEIGSYPVWGQECYHVRLTFESLNQENANRAADEFLGRFPDGILYTI